MGLVRESGRDNMLPRGTEGDSETVRRLVRDMLSDSVTSPVGRRTTEQIVERLLRKLQRADSPDKLAAALALVGDISKIRGAPDATLQRAEAILRSHGCDPASIGGLRTLFDVLPERRVPLSNVTLDLSFVPGIAYYTGTVFEISCEGEERPVTLGGGGRYDGLVKALGGEDVPAMGFALRPDRIANALADTVE